MRASAPMEHEGPRGSLQKTSKWTIVIQTGAFDGFINFAQPASAETYAYWPFPLELSRAARSTTESSADNGRTGEAHKAGKVRLTSILAVLVRFLRATKVATFVVFLKNYQKNNINWNI